MPDPKDSNADLTMSEIEGITVKELGNVGIHGERYEVLWPKMARNLPPRPSHE